MFFLPVDKCHESNIKSFIYIYKTKNTNWCFWFYLYIPAQGLKHYFFYIYFKFYILYTYNPGMARHKTEVGYGAVSGLFQYQLYVQYRRICMAPHTHGR